MLLLADPEPASNHSGSIFQIISSLMKMSKEMDNSKQLPCIFLFFFTSITSNVKIYELNVRSVLGWKTKNSGRYYHDYYTVMNVGKVIVMISGQRAVNPEMGEYGNFQQNASVQSSRRRREETRKILALNYADGTRIYVCK